MATKVGALGAAMRPSVRRGLRYVVPGMEVRLTSYFLLATGQLVGGETDRIWRVMACPCGLCARRNGRASGYCAVDEQLDTRIGFETMSVEEREGLRRHFALRNLEPVARDRSRRTRTAARMMRRTG